MKNQNQAAIAKKRAVQGVQYLLLSLAAVYVLFPLLFLIVSAFKADHEIFLNPFALPQRWLFENIEKVFIQSKFYRNMLNSVYYAVTSVALSVCVSVTAAYALTRMIWKSQKAVSLLLMSGIMIPIHAVILPLYLTVRSMGIKNPRIVLVFIFTAFALPKSIFIVSGFIKDIPRSLEESALIDGAGIFTILGRIIVPLLKPAIATVCIFDFLTVWNDLLLSLIFISRDADKTLQLGIMKFMGEYVTMYNLIFTAVLISIIPTLLIFVFFQRKIIEGITAGAVKG